MKILKITAAFTVAFMISLLVVLNTTDAAKRFTRGSDWVYVSGEKNTSANLQAILIDLSDTTNFKHDDTGHIILKDISSKICLQAVGSAMSVGDWRIRYGLVIRSDATDGDVLWFYSTKVMLGDTILSGGGRCFFPPGPGEVDLSIRDNQAKYITGGVRYIDDTEWDNDDVKATFISTEAGDTAINAFPGEGDVVVELLEGGGTWAFDLRVMAIYRTQ